MVFMFLSLPASFQLYGVVNSFPNLFRSDLYANVLICSDSVC